MRRIKSTAVLLLVSTISMVKKMFRPTISGMETAIGYAAKTATPSSVSRFDVTRVNKSLFLFGVAVEQSSIAV